MSDMTELRTFQDCVVFVRRLPAATRDELVHRAQAGVSDEQAPELLRGLRIHPMSGSYCGHWSADWVAAPPYKRLVYVLAALALFPRATLRFPVRQIENAVRVGLKSAEVQSEMEAARRVQPR